MILMSDVRCPMSDVSRAALKQIMNDGLEFLADQSVAITRVNDDIGHRTSDIGQPLTGANL